MKRYYLVLLLAVSLMVACRHQAVIETPTSTIATEPPKASPTLIPTLAATPEPPKTLTLCTAQLPENLFPYAGFSSPVKDSLLTILYESPFNTVNGDETPGILARIPSPENGDVRLEPAVVQSGQIVVDSEGELAVFKPGLQVRPSGCRNANCTVIWDGEEPLQMDRMVVDFQLREDLTWSDGTRVTAGDSVFSFELANAPEAPGLRWAEDRSESYQALDTRTIQWTGRPGFTTAEISKFFWNPLPAHLIDGIVDWAELVNSDALAFSPLSYGPFMMMARELDRIAFVPNPNYYGTAEGLPLLDELVFRQIEGDRTSAVQALRSGECDVLDASFGWENDLELLEEVISEEIIEFQMESGEAWWQLVFGIMPAEYDDSYNPNLGDRPNFFGDPAVRQALVACLDREAMRENSLGEWVPLWPSFLPPEGSHLEQDAGIRFDPEQGRANLEEVGWLDTNADSEIPRIAVNVPDVPQGSEFRLELLVDETGFQQDMAAIIQNSLTACGIGVDIRTLSNDELYAPGSEGPLFGRHFDLALIAWDAGPELDCRLYMDQAIPDQASQWVGTNIAGFAQPDYDRDCAEAGLALDENRKTLIREAEHSFLNQLPAIPLFSIPRFWLVSSSVCGSDILTQSKGNLNMIEFIMDDRNCP